MTNDVALLCAAKTRGKSIGDVAKAAGISRQAMLLKRQNVREFKSGEMKRIIEFLNLSTEEMMAIFFQAEVDETPTVDEIMKEVQS